ncbi:MAG: hypothetical protein KAT27_04315, partial [Desulfobacterales bacterium]|nr:hypothetical protein [Desulfobacterales bacterium]
VANCIKAPRIYKSSTLILVQPQEIPSNYVMSTVTSDARSRLNTLKEQVMSRPRLQEIIKKYDLYTRIRANETMYDAVLVMRNHIDLQVKETRGRNQAPGSFEVSYEGQQPAKVRNVTAAIANLFIEDNLKLREKQAAGTSKFLERELARMKEILRQKEELVRQFKEKNMGQLPEQMENNYRILTQLQQQIDSLNDNFQQTGNRKVLLQAQLGRIEAIPTAPPAVETAEGGRVEDQAALSLGELRRQLDNLKSRYSDKHPDVLRLAVTIAKREKEQETTISDSGSWETMARSHLSEAERVILAQREDLVTQLQLIDKEVRSLRAEKKKTGQEIEKYRHRIENGPRIEQMFVDLRRGYNEATANYQSLLEKRLQAELAENLERTQKGEQFRVLEPANLPQKPFKPDVFETLSMGFMLALGCGLGLAFLREYVDPTFSSSKYLESIVQMPVLVSVPFVAIKAEERWNLLKKTGAVGALVSMVSVLFYALFVLWKMDPTVFPIPLG